ncbi:MAG: hypothetical protein ABW019_00360 [Chitinophagaceae bacterium]
MKPRSLLLFLLFPVFVAAQEVQPILSDDYLSLISRDTLIKGRFLPDTTNSFMRSLLRSTGYYNGVAVRSIRKKDNLLLLQPTVYRYLRIGGSFVSAVELKKANREPKLQDRFVQGRSQGGVLLWRGPETGELFSFGPAISALEYDGSNYPYDHNGRLVPAGTGNGRSAQAYDNRITRAAVLTSNHLSFRTQYYVGANQVLAGLVKLSQAKENTFIRQNRNRAGTFSASLTANILPLSITGTFISSKDRFSNSNRGGFLNRVYQASLLTPASFDNGQGPYTGALQRSYSSEADNPYFLLNNDNFFHRSQRVARLVIEKKIGRLRYKIAQSLERIRQNTREGYEPGTAFFPGGIQADRQTDDHLYYLQANGSYSISGPGIYIDSRIEANYIFTGDRSAIRYMPGNAYRYRRRTHNAVVGYTLDYDQRNTVARLKLENGLYASNTTSAADFFLPAVSGFIRQRDLFYSGIDIKLAGTFTHFNSELPLSQSHAQNSLLLLPASQAFHYFPVTEVSGFDNLRPIRHHEWSARVELSYNYKLTLYAEVFNRLTRDDVFALPESGLLHLRNIASHRNRGVELALEWNTYSRQLTSNHRLSFFRNRSKVTGVTPGYDFTPIAGFSNIYKAVVKGQPLGVITGSSFVRDASGNMVIGSDGFPLKDAGAGIIGNPVPDFVVKLSNDFRRNQFMLNISWEWQKGGDMWNGTQAALDYYGRSKISGDLRNTTGYIFPGVTQSGHPNTVAVSFYDPALPVENNRWTRDGFGGIDEAYIQKASYIRINNLSLSYTLPARRYIQRVVFTAYAHNLLVWTAYEGGDPGQLLYDYPNTAGLDFFNLPSLQSFGCSVSIQF